MDNELRHVRFLDCDWRPAERSDPRSTPGGRPDYPTAEQVAAALRVRTPVSDRAFDHYLRHDTRFVSREHWTPLATVSRVAEWLDDLPVQSVVDIGSGAGKFCVAAGLASRCRFVGIEHRPRLVEAARSLAHTFEVGHRVTFVEGALGEIETPVADLYYLFNPFGENLYGADGHVDEDVAFSEALFDRDVARVEDVLARAPVGTYVLTYNGFGGTLPPEYCVKRTDYSLPNILRLSQKLA